jgi:hypothetical protein
MTAPQTVADVQHTPGPWTALLHTGNGVTVGRDDDWTITGADGQSVCWEGGPNDHADANARLIAAAPDLLAALSSILPSPLCGESWDLPDEEMVQITVTLGELRAARAALRAAVTSARQGESHVR